MTWKWDEVEGGVGWYLYKEFLHLDREDEIRLKLLWDIALGETIEGHEALESSRYDCTAAC